MSVADRLESLPVVYATPPRFARGVSTSSGGRYSESSTPRSESPVSRSSSFTRIAARLIESDTLTADDTQAALDRTAFGQTFKFLSAREVVENAIAPKPSPPMANAQNPLTPLVSSRSTLSVNLAVSDVAFNNADVHDEQSEECTFYDAKCYADDGVDVDVDVDVSNDVDGFEDKENNRNFRPDLSGIEASVGSRKRKSSRTKKHMPLWSSSGRRQTAKSAETRVLVDNYGMSEADANRELLRRAQSASGERTSPENSDVVNFSSLTRTIAGNVGDHPSEAYEQESMQSENVLAENEEAPCSGVESFSGNVQLSPTAEVNDKTEVRQRSLSAPWCSAVDHASSASVMPAAGPNPANGNVDSVFFAEKAPSQSSFALPSAWFPASAFTSSTPSTVSEPNLSDQAGPPSLPAVVNEKDDAPTTPLRFLQPDASSFVVVKSPEPLPPSPTTSTSLPPAKDLSEDFMSLPADRSVVVHGDLPSTDLDSIGNASSQDKGPVSGTEALLPATPKLASPQRLSLFRKSIARATAVSSRLNVGRKRRPSKVIVNESAVHGAPQSGDRILTDESSAYHDGITAETSDSSHLCKVDEHSIGGTQDRPLVIHGPSRPIATCPSSTNANVLNARSFDQSNAHPTRFQTEKRDGRVVRAPSNPYNALRVVQAARSPLSSAKSSLPHDKRKVCVPADSYIFTKPFKPLHSQEVEDRHHEQPCLASPGPPDSAEDVALQNDPKYVRGPVTENDNASSRTTSESTRADLDEKAEHIRLNDENSPWNEKTVAHKEEIEHSGPLLPHATSEVETALSDREVDSAAQHAMTTEDSTQSHTEAGNLSCSSLDPTSLSEEPHQSSCQQASHSAAQDPKGFMLNKSLPPSPLNGDVWASNLPEVEVHDPQPRNAGTVIIKRVIRRTKPNGSYEIVTERVRVKPVKIFPNGDVVVRRVIMQPKGDGSGDFESVFIDRTIRRKRADTEAKAALTLAASDLSTEKLEATTFENESIVCGTSTLNELTADTKKEADCSLDSIGDRSGRRFPDKPDTFVTHSNPFVPSLSRNAGSSGSPSTPDDCSPSGSTGCSRSTSFGVYEPVVHADDAPVSMPPHIAKRLFSDGTALEDKPFITVKSKFASIAPNEGFSTFSQSCHSPSCGSSPSKRAQPRAESDLIPSSVLPRSESNLSRRQIPRSRTLSNLFRSGKFTSRDGSVRESETPDKSVLEELSHNISPVGSLPEGGNRVVDLKKQDRSEPKGVSSTVSGNCTLSRGIHVRKSAFRFFSTRATPS